MFMLRCIKEKNGRSASVRSDQVEHLVEKNSRQINDLSMILSQKWFPLLRIML